MSRFNRRPAAFDVWPGFVDALTSLIMVMIFILLIFAVGQAVLSSSLAGKNQALADVHARIADLSRILAMTQEALDHQTVRLNQMAVEVEDNRSEEHHLKTELAASIERESRLSIDWAALQDIRRQLETELGMLTGQNQSARLELTKQTELNAASALRIETLNRQLADLRDQLAKVTAALDLAHRDKNTQDVKLLDLGQRLDAALASQVSKLERYRSEFFGKLREALGNRSDVRVVGDRFVVPTDILFHSGSAELDPEAEPRLAQLVGTLRELSGKIPGDIDWVLRIDGHTDRIPIHNDRFPSNWELSTARAVAIVKYFIALGIPAERLSANGFGQYQLLDPADTPSAHAKNRRIELQLTNR